METYYKILKRHYDMPDKCLACIYNYCGKCYNEWNDGCDVNEDN